MCNMAICIGFHCQAPALFKQNTVLKRVPL
jgi:hypothetical protein